MAKMLIKYPPKIWPIIMFKKTGSCLRNPGTQVYESEVEDYSGKIHNVVFHKATFPNLDGSVGGLIGAIFGYYRK